MHTMSYIDRFQEKATAYALGRPSYPTAAVDAMFACADKDVAAIADVGSGTGILTRQLLERGPVVYAVEPNDDMRAQADLALGSCPNYRSICAVAEHTTLDDRSVDVVTAAQAFHWFDPVAFRSECARILRDDGNVFLLWNAREDAPIHRRLSAICKAYCPTFDGFSGGMRRDDPRIRAFFDDAYDRWTFPCPIRADRQRFVERALSSSYAPRRGERTYDAYVAALHELFSEFCDGDAVSLPHSTVVYRNTRPLR